MLNRDCRARARCNSFLRDSLPFLSSLFVAKREREKKNLAWSWLVIGSSDKSYFLIRKYNELLHFCYYANEIFLKYYITLWNFKITSLVSIFFQISKKNVISRKFSENIRFDFRVWAGNKFFIWFWRFMNISARFIRRGTTWYWVGSSTNIT